MKKYGLALGGGAILGAAHIGVLQSIEEHNIQIEYIAGTSIGALVAAFIAFGLCAKDIQDIALNLNRMDISGMRLSKYGLLSNEKLGELITKHIGKKNIEDSNIPLAIVATDISTGEKKVFTTGSVADAVMASACIPGVFIPKKLNNTFYVDGGLVENLPLSTIRDMGAKEIIAVDLHAYHGKRTPKNIIDILVNSFHFMLQSVTKKELNKVALLVQPDLAAYNFSDTKNVSKLIEAGYTTMNKVIESSSHK